MADERPPAHSIEIEQALLGAILVNNDAFNFIDGLRADHFYEPIHRLIFEGAQALVQGGKQATPLTVRTIIPAGLKIGDITAQHYLARLAADATSVINAKDYAENLRALSQIRELEGILERVRQYDERHVFPGAALREAYVHLDNLRLDEPTRQHAEMIGPVAERFTTWMSGVMSGDVTESGVLTGLADLDRMMGGLRGGNLIIVGARPGMGKTALAGGVALPVAKAGHGVGFFSLEMSDEQLMARLHCDECFNDRGEPITYNNALRPKTLSMQHGQRILDAERRIAGLPLMFDFSSRLTVGEIAAKARGMAMMLQRKFGTALRLLVVDYLKFVQATDRYKGNRVYEVGEIASGLKQVAKDLNCCVILLCQLSRKVEERDEKVPQLADLRESGDLEADADAVLFIYREAYYLQNDPRTANDIAKQTRLVECINRMLLILAKNRHGPTGNVEAFCHMGASAIRNLHRQEDNEEMML